LLTLVNKWINALAEWHKLTLLVNWPVFKKYHIILPDLPCVIPYIVKQ